ncbi:helix-turn-helix transcriptional regulator [Subtercola endophyticus]|uniref:helix-turn-helix transcriptional regulator n=1 Tax=Subtercola endophyticus TaxID=2895559 RepID=UPI001E39FE12|nr:LuxR family transcriptional regulator [Subtercola endophyticus]UFS60246.1 LuxR C-terminal-related transcriptional regulator [Subtercola endophyticus]
MVTTADTTRRSALTKIVSLAAHREENSLVVRGSRGSGRTHLLESALEAVSVRSILVRVNRSEMDYPLSGLSAVFAKVGDSRLAEFSGRFALVSSAPDDLFAAADQLLTLLRGLSLEPVMILIDDVDFMDAESLSILGYVSTRLTSTNICLVVTARAGADAPDAARPSPAAVFSGAPTVTLAPLSGAETRELISSVASPALDDSTRQIVAEYADGNPLAVFEIVQALPTMTASVHIPLVLPFRLGASAQAVAAEAISTLPDPVVFVLQKISSAPLTSIEALVDSDAAASDALDELVASHLVTVESHHVRVADNLVRSGTYWGMPSNERRAIHRELAVDSTAFDPPLALWHESWASARGARADELLLAAASLAKRGYPGAAVELAERAIATRSNDDVVIAELADLSDALLGRGSLTLALRYCQEALTLDTSVSDDLALQSIKLQAEFLRDEYIAPNEVEARLTPPAAAPSAQSNQVLLSAAVAHAERGEIADAREITDHLAGLRRGESVNESLYWPLALVRALSGVLEPLALAATIAPDPATQPLAAQVAAGRALSFAEHHSESRKTFVGLLVHAPETDRRLIESARIFAAENDIRSGYLQHAMSFIDGLPHESEVLRFRRVTLQGWSAETRGQKAEATPFFAEGAELLEHERNPVLAARYFSLQGTFDLMHGDIDRSLDHFHRVRSITKSLTMAFHARHNVDLIEATVLSGAAREARALMLEFDELRAQLPSHWSTLAAARGRALLAPDERVIASFDEAITSYKPDDSPYELARLMLAYATRLDQMALSDQAAAAHVGANQIFTSMGAMGWLHTPGIRPQRVAEPPPTTAGLTANLTPGELDVVRLLGRGYRNKEIAARLFVSLRTVEVRLTQIYRKSGARSRSHLLALLANTEPSDVLPGASTVNRQLGGPA